MTRPKIIALAGELAEKYGVDPNDATVLSVCQKSSLAVRKPNAAVEVAALVLGLDESDQVPPPSIPIQEAQVIRKDDVGSLSDLGL